MLLTEDILAALHTHYPHFFNTKTQVSTDQVSEQDDHIVSPNIIYYVPDISKLVNTKEIEKLKGSDASNFYNEEPNEAELEYSDDENERQAKFNRKKKHFK